MAIYRLRATNEHGQADCEAKLVYDSKYIEYYNNTLKRLSIDRLCNLLGLKLAQVA